MRRTLLLASAAALLAAPAFAQPAPAQNPGAAVPAPGGAPSAASQTMRVSTQEFLQRVQMSDRFELASGRLAQQQAGAEAVKNFAAEMVRDHTKTTQELTELTRRLGPAVMSQAGQPGQGAATSGMANDSRSGTGASPGAAQSGSVTSAQRGTTGMSGSQGSATGMTTTAQGGVQAEGLDMEHQALMQRLTQLRGAEFDRLYIMGQVQGHQKAVDLFTAYAQSGDQAELKQWAAKTLPTLQHHLQRAQQIQQGL